MMVIKGTLPADSFGVGTNLVTDEYILPADACSWQQESSGNGYTIANAYFMLNGSAVAISSPAMGVIGKSGRFVEITV